MPSLQESDITSLSGPVETDLVIVGAGPVGLALALQCRGSGRRVLVIESGADAEDPELFDLARGERAQPYSMLPIPTQQARQLGGNSNLWHLHRPDGTNGVRLVELDEVDFERRDDVGAAGWPFSKDTLRPWYAQAAERCGIVDFAQLAPPKGIETAQVTTRWAQVPLASTVFEGWVEQIRADPDTTVLTGATGTRVVLNADTPNLIDAVEVTFLSGRTATIKATDFVIAGGGYDNARFLLSQDPLAGTPLGDDTVTGRYLMDHPLDFGDYLSIAPISRNRAVFSRDFDMMQPADSPAARLAYLTLRSDYAAANGLLGMSTWLYPRTKAVPIDKGPAALRFLTGRGVAPTYPGTGGRRPLDLGRAAVTMALAWQSTAHWLSKEKLFAESTRGPGLNDPGWPAEGTPSAFRFWELVRLIEQPGRAENRVKLSDNRDRLGRRRILIDWSWAKDDAELALRTKAILDSAVRPFGTKLSDERLALARPGTGHITGCTRLHVDPRLGVADPDCLVHGTRNLYLAGSSLFPTSGWANPTYTAIALALRLGHHLTGKAAPTRIADAGERHG